MNQQLWSGGVGWLERKSHFSNLLPDHIYAICTRTIRSPALRACLLACELLNVHLGDVRSHDRHHGSIHVIRPRPSSCAHTHIAFAMANAKIGHDRHDDDSRSQIDHVTCDGVRDGGRQWFVTDLNARHIDGLSARSVWWLISRRCWRVYHLVRKAYLAFLCHSPLTVATSNDFQRRTLICCVVLISK